jgi:hypothetical protein
MLKISVVILTIMLAFAAVYSVMTIAVPELFIQDAYEVLTGQPIKSVLDEPYMRLSFSVGRHLGAMSLASTLSGLFILYGAFRKVELWSWWALLVVGGLSWGWGLVDNMITGSVINTIMHGGGTVAFLVGLLLSVGVFFGKKA